MESIGKYTIVRQIGLGGFGVVYEGTDPFLKRRVAIKTCTTDEEEIRDRFFREAEIAGNLKHHNIVTVHDFGVQDGVPYLVQEYLSGEDLARVIARREPLTAERKLELLLQAAEGLEYAHSRGVIHRDVKPANIRVTEDGAVKIMDFGIAKLANVASHLTRTGMTLGTAAYLPPEQIRGSAVDHRADLFSFGVLAFELLAYRRPFVGRTISVLFFEILHREPPALSEIFPGCPPSLAKAVHRCLAKDPDTRYPGFGPLITDLVRGLREVRASPPPPLPERPPAAQGRPPVPVPRPAAAPAASGASAPPAAAPPAPHLEDPTTVHDRLSFSPPPTATQPPAPPQTSTEALTPPEAPPPPKIDEIPLIERATRKVSAETLRRAAELAAREHRAAAATAPSAANAGEAPRGAGTAPEPPKTPATAPGDAERAQPATQTTWGPAQGADPPGTSVPAAPGEAARQAGGPPSAKRSRPQQGVPYPSPPKPRSFWEDVPWPLIGALGVASLLFVLAVLLAIYFAF